MDGETVLQDSDAELDIVNGKTIERLWGMMTLDAETREVSPCYFWLKMAEETWWNRFFAESYLAVWEIYPEINQDDLDEEEMYPVHDIGEQLGLYGKRITHVECSTDKESTTVLRIVLSSGEELRIRTTRDDACTMELVQLS